MTDDQGKTSKKQFGDRVEKAKGRLQQSFPEIQQLIKTSNAIDVARKIINPAQSIFRQFADDIQLKDLLAKVDALVANTNLTFTKPVPKDTPATPTFRDATPASESSKDAEGKKTPAKRMRSRKAVPKKTPSKKKKKPSSKRVRTGA
jgi:hypothetical protein